MNKIKEFRDAAGLTQKQLALASGWPNSENRIGNYETGLRTPSIQDAYKIVSALNQNGANCSFYDVFPPSQSLKQVS